MPSGPSPRHSLDLATPVLIVDDMMLMLSLLSTIVHRLGFTTVETARSGIDALFMLRAKAYGLVLCDLKMTPVSGLDVVRSVREDEALKGIRFVMMTASLDTDDVLAAKRAGVDDYILKPFTPAALMQKLGPLT